MVPPLPHRYSHSCVAQGHHVLLVGGVGPSALTLEEQFVLADLEHGLWWFMDVGDSAGLYGEMLLIRHCTVYDHSSNAIAIIGGGGSCFSFGALFNDRCTLFRWKRVE